MTKRVTLQSFDWRALVSARQLEPGIEGRRARRKRVGSAFVVRRAFGHGSRSVDGARSADRARRDRLSVRRALARSRARRAPSISTTCTPAAGRSFPGPSTARGRCRLSWTSVSMVSSRITPTARSGSCARAGSGTRIPVRPTTNDRGAEAGSELSRRSARTRAAEDHPRSRARGLFSARTCGSWRALEWRCRVPAAGISTSPSSGISIGRGEPQRPQKTVRVGRRLGENRSFVALRRIGALEPAELGGANVERCGVRSAVGLSAARAVAEFDLAEFAVDREGDCTAQAARLGSHRNLASRLTQE